MRSVPHSCCISCSALGHVLFGLSLIYNSPPFGGHGACHCSLYKDLARFPRPRRQRQGFQSFNSTCSASDAESFDTTSRKRPSCSTMATQTDERVDGSSLQECDYGAPISRDDSQPVQQVETNFMGCEVDAAGAQTCLSCDGAQREASGAAAKAGLRHRFTTAANEDTLTAGTSGGSQCDNQGHSVASSHAGSRRSARHSARSERAMQFSHDLNINEDMEVDSTMPSTGPARGSGVGCTTASTLDTPVVPNGEVPQRPAKGQRRRRKRHDRQGGSSPMEQGFVTVASRVQARAHKAWATETGRRRRISDSRLPSAVMANFAGRDLDVLHLTRLPTGRPPPPLHAALGSTVHAVASTGAFNFGQAARQEDSSWLRVALSQSNFRLDV